MIGEQSEFHKISNSIRTEASSKTEKKIIVTKITQDLTFKSNQGFGLTVVFSVLLRKPLPIVTEQADP